MSGSDGSAWGQPMFRADGPGHVDACTCYACCQVRNANADRVTAAVGSVNNPVPDGAWVVHGESLAFYECKVCDAQFRGADGCPECRRRLVNKTNQTAWERVKFVRRFVTRNYWEMDEGQAAYRGGSAHALCIKEALEFFDEIEAATK